MPGSDRLPVSDNELDVIHVLWQRGPATLREVHERLAARYEYTTVQTMLDRLVQKGLISRDRRPWPARYKARLSRGTVLRHYLNVVTEKISGGAAPLVLQLLRESSFTSAELAAIRQLIQQAETREEKNHDTP